KALSGEYEGAYHILYTDSTSKQWQNEAGHTVKGEYDSIIAPAVISITDRDMRSVFFHRFPVSILSKVVDADAALSEALSQTAPVDIQVTYNIRLDTDYTHVEWYTMPTVLPLTLTYGGTEHRLRIQLGNGSIHHLFSPEELAQPIAFSGWRYLELDVNALYDGERLVQKFDMWSGNGMTLVFRQKKD
ncbi:MAG: DUF4840 domain-containing protein, partial [Bacteroidaceae bacterium]|nr:DUF4840 domain-containing protein [Bacteroidaceae bacterium]